MQLLNVDDSDEEEADTPSGHTKRLRPSNVNKLQRQVRLLISQWPTTPGPSSLQHEEATVSPHTAAAQKRLCGKLGVEDFGALAGLLHDKHLARGICGTLFTLVVIHTRYVMQQPSITNFLADVFLDTVALLNRHHLVPPGTLMALQGGAHDADRVAISASASSSSPQPVLGVSTDSDFCLSAASLVLEKATSWWTSPPLMCWSREAVERTAANAVDAIEDGRPTVSRFVKRLGATLFAFSLVIFCHADFGQRLPIANRKRETVLAAMAASESNLSNIDTYCDAMAAAITAAGRRKSDPPIPDLKKKIQSAVVAVLLGFFSAPALPVEDLLLAAAANEGVFMLRRSSELASAEAMLTRAGFQFVAETSETLTALRALCAQAAADLGVVADTAVGLFAPRPPSVFLSHLDVPSLVPYLARAAGDACFDRPPTNSDLPEREPPIFEAMVRPTATPCGVLAGQSFVKQWDTMGVPKDPEVFRCRKPGSSEAFLSASPGVSPEPSSFLPGSVALSLSGYFDHQISALGGLAQQFEGLELSILMLSRSIAAIDAAKVANHDCGVVLTYLEAMEERAAFSLQFWQEESARLSDQLAEAACSKLLPLPCGDAPPLCTEDGARRERFYTHLHKLSLKVDNTKAEALKDASISARTKRLAQELSGGQHLLFARLDKDVDVANAALHHKELGPFLTKRRGLSLLQTETEGGQQNIAPRPPPKRRIELKGARRIQPKTDQDAERAEEITAERNRLRDVFAELFSSDERRAFLCQIPILEALTTQLDALRAQGQSGVTAAVVDQPGVAAQTASGPANAESRAVDSEEEPTVDPPLVPPVRRSTRARATDGKTGKRFRDADFIWDDKELAAAIAAAERTPRPPTDIAQLPKVRRVVQPPCFANCNCGLPPPPLFTRGTSDERCKDYIMTLSANTSVRAKSCNCSTYRWWPAGREGSRSTP
jgi:hypothetical protein